MTNEKYQSLKKHAASLKDRLNSPTPEKHAHRPAEYREFLTRELKLTENIIASALLGMDKIVSK